MRLAATLACLVLAAAPAAAVDYDKVGRRLAKEPKYQTKTPRYVLLLFGPEARLGVWVVLDGETLYVDRDADGDLTGADERFATESDCKAVEIADPDGKTRYVIDRVQTDHSLYTPKMLRERQEKGLPPGLGVYVSIKGAVEYQQYCDVVEMKADPRAAALAHFHGPLTVQPMTIDFKLPAGAALRKGPDPTEFRAVVGTLSEKHGCWVVVRSCDGKKAAFPDGVRPVAEVEFPAAAGEKPVKKTYTLGGYCCEANFLGKLPVPAGVGVGTAKVRLSFESWKEGRVAPSTVEVPVRE
jgi:hypothetical protein